MTGNKEYRLAVALLQFKSAYAQLATASLEMPEYDISQSYPFYLLDFEEITPAVLQWCTIHATNLMKSLPDRVDNPACADCEHLRAGISKNGLCTAPKSCIHYPYISYLKESVQGFFATRGIDIAGLSDNEIHLLYIRKMDDIYESRQN